MGYRTHLTLKMNVKSTKIEGLEGEYKTYVNLLNYECIGKAYFDELPQFKEPIELENLWYNEYSDSGEITVGDLLLLLNTIEDTKKDYKQRETESDVQANWYNQDFKKLIKSINKFLELGLIYEDDWIQFEVF